MGTTNPNKFWPFSAFPGCTLKDLPEEIINMRYKSNPDGTDAPVIIAETEHGVYEVLPDGSFQLNPSL